MTQDTAGFFAGSIPAFQFGKHGDTAQGEIIRTEIRQQTDFDTGRLLYWDDGRPRNQAVITVQQQGVPPENDEDDGVRNLYVRGAMQRAFVEALRKAKLRQPEPGCYVKVTYTGDEQPARKGVSGAKLYDVVIAPPKRAAS